MPPINKMPGQSYYGGRKRRATRKRGRGIFGDIWSGIKKVGSLAAGPLVNFGLKKVLGGRRRRVGGRKRRVMRRRKTHKRGRGLFDSLLGGLFGGRRRRMRRRRGGRRRHMRKRRGGARRCAYGKYGGRRHMRRRRVTRRRGRGIGSLLSRAHGLVRKHKLVSRGLNMIDNKWAKRAGKVANFLGYGRRRRGGAMRMSNYA